MLRTVFSSRRRAATVAVALAVCVAATPRDAERLGDSLQVALPLLAWGCAAANGGAGEFLLRYTVMLAAAHGSKAALAGTEVNRRPLGGDAGMPSAHTSTAVLGASSIVHDCIRRNPAVRAATIMSAAFVGGSRIEADRHDIWQVLAGALLGYGCDRALRRPSPQRRRVAAALQVAAEHLGAGWAVFRQAAAAALGRAGAVAQGLRSKIVSRTRLPDPMLTASIRPAAWAEAARRRISSWNAASSVSLTKASAQGAAATAAAASAPGNSRMSRRVWNTIDGSP
jgi:membrane-associated phospholipid phosphatase